MAEIDWENVGLEYSIAELDAEHLRVVVAIAVSTARRELIERCIERAYLWAVMAGTQTARQMALALAREMREMGKEE